MSDDSIEALCHRCGQTFSTFLHEMADQNAKVVCPNCQDGRDCTSSESTPGTAATVKKPN